jgi:hypothetical protein
MEKAIQLELKQLAAYLPYGLKIMHYNEVLTLQAISPINTRYKIGIGEAFQIMRRLKPILRPLSDLNKKIIIDEKPRILINELCKIMERKFDINTQLHQFCNLFIEQHEWCEPFDYIKFTSFFFEHHFDVFGLIDAGLAVDINNINP